MIEFGVWASKVSNAFNVNYWFTRNATSWSSGHVARTIATESQQIAER
jgi:hypothetical protein